MATTVAAQSIPRDANALWPGSDEDLRWRPGASLACHFARAIANKLSEVDPQAASDQGSLRRGRDSARQRWPFGQHKLTVCHGLGPPCPGPCVGFAGGLALWSLAETRYLRWTTTVAAQSFPRDANALWPGSDEDLRWRPGASLACHFAHSITNKLSKVDPQVASRPVRAQWPR